MTTTNETMAAGEMKMNGGFGKFHAVESTTGVAVAAVCGVPVFMANAMVESVSHVNCARCLKKLGRENLH